MPSKTKLVGHGGEVLHSHDGSLAVMRHSEYEHHEGNKFGLSQIDMAVGNGSGDEFTLLAFMPWSGEVSISATMGNDDVGIAAMYENPTVVNSGTAIASGNLNRNSDNSSYVSWYGGAALVASGTGVRLMISRIGTAGNKSLGGQAGTGEHKLLCKRSGLYAFVFYADNAATGLTMDFDYIEKM